jgi:hypothetical protein
MQHSSSPIYRMKFKVNASTFFLALGIVLSMCGNALLFFKLKQSVKAPAPTLEAKEMLASLATGQAILRITVLDPENLMLRSPRR